MLTLAKRRLSTQTGHFGRVVDPSSSTKTGENTFEIRIRIEKQFLEKSNAEDFYIILKIHPTRFVLIMILCLKVVGQTLLKKT